MVTIQNDADLCKILASRTNNLPNILYLAQGDDVKKMHENIPDEGHQEGPSLSKHTKTVIKYL